MADITRSVGAGGENQRHDVLIVQLMLRKVKNQRDLPYFGGGYTSPYGGDTAQAIASFQGDSNLTGTKPDAGAPTNESARESSDRPLVRSPSR